MDHIQQTEHKVTNDLKAGRSIDASVTLQDEFTSNPAEALAFVKKTLLREQSQGTDKNTLGVEGNGDVFVYDKDHTGYYAGTIPPNLLQAEGVCPTSYQPTAATQPDMSTQPAENPPAPITVEQLPPIAGAPPDASPYPDDNQLAAFTAEQLAAITATPPDASPYPILLGGTHVYEYPQPGYDYPSAKHPHGIPFPIQVGVDHGSLQLGLNLFGAVDGGITLGAHNRGYVGSDIARTQFSAGVDLNRDHVGPAADWSVFQGGLTHGSARVGFDSRPYGVNAGASVDAAVLGDNGVAVGAGVSPYGPEAYAEGYSGD